MGSATNYSIDDADEAKSKSETFEVDGKTLTKEELMEAYRQKRIYDTEMPKTRAELNKYKAAAEVNKQQTVQDPGQTEQVNPNLVRQLAEVLQKQGGLMSQADLELFKANQAAVNEATKRNRQYKGIEGLEVTSDELLSYMQDHNYSSASEAFNAMKAAELAIHSKEVADGFKKTEVPGSGSNGVTLDKEALGIAKIQLKPEDLNKTNRRATIGKIFERELAANGITDIDQFYRDQGWSN